MDPAAVALGRKAKPDPQRQPRKWTAVATSVTFLGHSQAHALQPGVLN